MSLRGFQFSGERTIRIDGNRKPSGRLRRTETARFRCDNPVRVCGQLVRKVDEVFRPELEEDSSFFVPQYDPDVRFAAIVDDPANFYVAVGRYLDSVHGTVVGAFVCPATPSDFAEYASREAHDRAA